MPTQSFDTSVKILLLINPKFKPKNSIPEPYCQATHEVEKWEISTQDCRQCWRESANRRLPDTHLYGYSCGSWRWSFRCSYWRRGSDLSEKLRRGCGRKGGGPKKNLVSRSVKTGLQFPVGRIGRCLKKGRHSQCIGTDVLVYLVVVLEWLLLSELQLEVYCLHWKR
ncbi:hypothetical protein AAG906_002153 [Vitis piasezkii]